MNSKLYYDDFSWDFSEIIPDCDCDCGSPRPLSNSLSLSSEMRASRVACSSISVSLSAARSKGTLSVAFFELRSGVEGFYTGIKFLIP